MINHIINRSPDSEVFRLHTYPSFFGQCVHEIRIWGMDAGKGV